MSAVAATPDPPATPGPSTESVARFVERFGSSLTNAGMPRLPSRVFAALIAAPDGRLTAADLAEQLSVSPAAISGAVRYLTQVHLIHREREPGSRRDVFVVADDAWHGAMLQSSRVYEPLRQALADGVEAVGGPSSRAGQRLQLSVDFLSFLATELEGVAARWEARRRAPAVAVEGPP